MEEVTINSTRHHVYNYAESLPGLVNSISYLLSKTCLVKLQTKLKFDVTDVCICKNLARFVDEKYTELEEMSTNPAALVKLCILTIRKHMKIKTDQMFIKLGLPATLLSMVTFSCVADDIRLMRYDDGGLVFSDTVSE